MTRIPMTSIPLDLLWRAWPDGYLPMRGVTTVGGWICTDPGPCSPLGTSLAVHWDIEARFTRPDWAPMLYPADPGDVAGVRNLVCDDGEHGRGMETERANGRLLPRVDPTDIATWACLVHDLGEAMNKRAPTADGPITLPWSAFGFDPQYPGCCFVGDSANGGQLIRWKLAPSDNASTARHNLPLALVYSRIACRERGF